MQLRVYDEHHDIMVMASANNTNKGENKIVLYCRNSVDVTNHTIPLGTKLIMAKDQTCSSVAQVNPFFNSL